MSQYRAAALLFVLSLPLFSQPFDAKAFQSLKWRSIGPLRGGRSITISGSDARPNEYYFGAVGGGLWKTTDGGNSWKPVTDGKIKTSSVGAVAVAPSNPDIVYMGMGETELRGNIMQGDGVYKTADAGKTWQNIGLEDSQAISRVRVHPTDPNTVYVAAFGHPYGPNEMRGVYRTKDGGKSWRRILYRNDHCGAVDLSIDPKNPNLMYAAIWDAYRTPWSMSSGGPGSGLFKSTDGGDTWTEITRNTGMPTGVIGKIGVAVSPVEPNRVWAIVENENGGVYRSDDAGATWAKISEDRKVRQRAFYYSRIYADTKEKDTIYVLNTSFFKSIDGGKTFKVIKDPHGDNHDLWISPSDNNRMANSNDGGGNISLNGGETWTKQNYATAQLYHVSTTKDFPYHVCGAQQDNSTVCVPSDAARNMRDPRSPVGSWMYAVGGGESGYIAPHPKNPNLFYAGSQGALLTRYDRSTGHTRDIQVFPMFFSGQSAATLKERWQWTFPIVFSPHDSSVLYTSSQHLWRTLNDGQSWEKISPDLTRADPKTLGDSGGPITKDQNGPEIYATIFAVAPSKIEPNTIWTGSDDGLAYITRDGGKNWTNITPKGLPEFSRISIIDVSATQAGTAYLCAKRYQLDDRRPYIFRTKDYGAHWTSITNGIAPDDFVHTVREDVKRPGLLYAGTEHGVYVSFDDGEHWQSLQLDLPGTQVSDLVVEQNDLVAGTHGRSFYILENLSVLRQMTPAVIEAPVSLLKPAPAIRGVNPAAVDYFLAKASDKVTVDILDAKGALVRSFVGSVDEDKKEKKDDEDSDSEFAGPPKAKPPTRVVGANRFSWDLRYPGAKVFEGMIMWGARAESGPLAVPGSYQVRLTANGVTQIQTFDVMKDPRRANVTDADLLEQFNIAIEIRDKVSAANEAVIKIRELKKQLKDRADQSKDLAISAAAERLTTRLSQVEEELYQVRNRSNQDPLNFPIKLNNLIAALGRSVTTGDNKPTDQSHVVLQELTDRLNAELKRLNEALGGLPELNRMVQQKSLKAIEVK